jgi:hypothetical protein
MTKNRKITLATALAMLISIFLPFMKIMGQGASLLKAAQAPMGTERPIALIVLIIAFAILTFMNKHLIARICSIVILGISLYVVIYFSSKGGNIFSILGIGAYLLIISSILGAIFSKSSN